MRLRLRSVGPVPRIWHKLCTTKDGIIFGRTGKALEQPRVIGIGRSCDCQPVRKGQEDDKGFIVRLMEKAIDEAEHKGWNDTELSKNE